MDSIKDDPIIRVKDIPAFLGVSVRCVYQWRSSGLFPQPIKLGPRASGYRESTLRDFLNARIGSQAA